MSEVIGRLARRRRQYQRAVALPLIGSRTTPQWSVTRSLDALLVDACFEGDPRRVAALLSKGALPNAVSPTGTTAVYAAALHVDSAIVRLLLEAGADPNVESTGDGEGTPLCAAACWGYHDVVRELLVHGAEPGQREDGGLGYSPLLWASRNGHGDTVRVLLEADADPNANVGGDNALHAAVRRGSLPVVRLLLDHGADTRGSGEDGGAPLQLAEAWADKDVEDELRRCAAALDSEEVRCRREPRPDGTELIVVEVRSSDGGGRDFEQETGHRQIAALLRSGGPEVLTDGDARRGSVSGRPVVP